MFAGRKKVICKSNSHKFESINIQLHKLYTIESTIWTWIHKLLISIIKRFNCKSKWKQQYYTAWNFHFIGTFSRISNITVVSNTQTKGTFTLEFPNKIPYYSNASKVTFFCSNRFFETVYNIKYNLNFHLYIYANDKIPDTDKN